MDLVGNILAEDTLEGRAKVLIIQDCALVYDLTEDLVKERIKCYKHIINTVCRVIKKHHGDGVDFKVGEEFDFGVEMPTSTHRRAFQLLTGRTLKIIDRGDGPFKNYFIKLWETPSERAVREADRISQQINEQSQMLQRLQDRLNMLQTQVDAKDPDADLEPDADAGSDGDAGLDADATQSMLPDPQGDIATSRWALKKGDLVLRRPRRK